MENTENVRDRRDRRRESSERRQEGGYIDVSKAAVRKEGDVKQDMGPSVSMTVVGETVNFTQHFNF